MATLSDGESSEEDGIAEMPEMTWDEASNLLASPGVGDAGSDTEDEEGHPMVRPARQGDEAGAPGDQEDAWMDPATRKALAHELDQEPAPEDTPLRAGVLDSAGELMPRRSDAGVQEMAPLHSGNATPASGDTTPVSGGMAPAIKDTTPVSGGMAPAIQDTTPEGGGTVPASGGMAAPVSGGTAPVGGGTAPASGGMAAVPRQWMARWLPVHRGSLGAVRRQTAALPLHRRRSTQWWL